MKEDAFQIFTRRYDKIMIGGYNEELVEDGDCDSAKFVDACKKVGQIHVDRP